MRIHETADAFFNGEKYINDFIEYWKAHVYYVGSGLPAVFSEASFMDNFSITSTGGQNYINSKLKINIVDHDSTMFPFKMWQVSGMRLHMRNLNTLENMPRYVTAHFNIERFDSGGLNSRLTSMVGGPERAGHLGFDIAQPLENLQTGLTGPIESISIHAPEIRSFAGLNVRCSELLLVIPNQHSISGIHKQLRNVEQLRLILPPNFRGGLLGLAMVPGLKKITYSGVLPNNTFAMKKGDYIHAFDVINAGKAKGMNVHDIQEEMIEAGLKAFATL